MANILVIDPDKRLCEVRQIMLEDAGHIAYIAPDLGTANTIMTEHNIALIITEPKFLPDLERPRKYSSAAEIIISGTINKQGWLRDNADRKTPYHVKGENPDVLVGLVNTSVSRWEQKNRKRITSEQYTTALNIVCGTIEILGQPQKVNEKLRALANAGCAAGDLERDTLEAMEQSNNGFLQAKREVFDIFRIYTNAFKTGTQDPIEVLSKLMYPTEAYKNPNLLLFDKLLALATKTMAESLGILEEVCGRKPGGSVARS